MAKRKQNEGRDKSGRAPATHLKQREPQGDGRPTAMRAAVRWLTTATVLGVVVVVSALLFLRSRTGSDAGLEPTTSPAVVNNDILVEWSSEESEEFAASASRRLKEVAKLMGVPDRLSAKRLAGLVTDDFVCSEFRPADLEEIFRDDALTVLRPLRPDNSVPQSHRGATGLRNALAEMLKGMGGTSPVRVAFKVFRVEREKGLLQTTAYYQASGRTDTGTVQQSATWICRWRIASGDAAPRIAWIESRDYEEVVAKGSSPLFADCTESVLGTDAAYRDQLRPGVDYWLTTERAHSGRTQTSSLRGLTIGDVNGDGLEDVYVCQGSGMPNRLFVQKPDGTATDVSHQAGVDFLETTTSALFVDLDNDGDQDLLVAIIPGVLILENDSSGVFALRATKFFPHASPTSLAVADYDNDGDLDCYVCCYQFRPRADEQQEFPIPYHDANNGPANALLQNEGDWRFRYVIGDVGLGQNNRRWSFVGTWEDYDNDGDVDLYVANDFGRNNLYRNDNGRFKDVAAEAGVEDMSAGMSVAWGDYDNDGWMDLYVSNMFSSAGNRVTYQRPFRPGASVATRAQFRRHARGNSLFKNAGDGTFKDVSVSSAVTMGRWAWGSRFIDINNDGWEDVLVANGFVTQTNPDDL